jgi:hypothetical protein
MRAIVARSSRFLQTIVRRSMRGVKLQRAFTRALP